MTAQSRALQEALDKGQIFKTPAEEVERLRRENPPVREFDPGQKTDLTECARGPCIEHKQRVYLWHGGQCYAYYREEPC